jgi:exosome complex component RRP45
VTFAYFEKFVLDLFSNLAADHRSLPPIIDPTHLEATLSTGSLSLTLNAQRELCVLSKAGGTPLMPGEIMGVVRVGVDRVREMVKKLEEALARDREERVIEVR